MRPAARLQAAIDIVDEVIEAAHSNGPAADTIVTRYFKSRRYAGSKDRRAIRDLVYAAIRNHGSSPVNGRSAFIGLARSELPELVEQFDGSEYGPAAIKDSEVGEANSLMSDWLGERFSPQLNKTDIDSLEGRAPLDIRVNLAQISRDHVLDSIERSTPGTIVTSAVRLETGFPVQRHELWQNGLIDIQDEGSQAIAAVCDPQEGSKILDLCAGAGGKTLALFDLVAGKADFVASDTDRSRLSKLAPRAKRCQMSGIESRLLDPGGERETLSDLSRKCDLILVDAPCTGTGTWRRNPEARWRLTPERIEGYVKKQRHLLDLVAGLLAPDGILVYAVCSLLLEEGEGQISDFLQSHSEFRKVEPSIDAGMAAGDGYLLTPARHGTDGFFFARLQREC